MQAQVKAELDFHIYLCQRKLLIIDILINVLQRKKESRLQSYISSQSRTYVSGDKCRKKGTPQPSTCALSITSISYIRNSRVLQLMACLHLFQIILHLVQSINQRSNSLKRSGRPGPYCRHKQHPSRSWKRSFELCSARAKRALRGHSKNVTAVTIVTAGCEPFRALRQRHKHEQKICDARHITV